MSLNNDDEIGKALRASHKETLGEYPDGRLNAEDQGATSVAVGSDNGTVVLRFAAPVAWIGFPPAAAMEIAVALMKHARRAGHKEPLVFRVGESRPRRGDAP